MKLNNAISVAMMATAVHAQFNFGGFGGIEDMFKDVQKDLNDIAKDLQDKTQEMADNIQKQTEDAKRQWEQWTQSQDTQEIVNKFQTAMDQTADTVQSIWGEAMDFKGIDTATEWVRNDILAWKGSDVWGSTEEALDQFRQQLKESAIFDFARVPERVQAFWEDIGDLDMNIPEVKQQVQIYGRLLGMYMERSLDHFLSFDQSDLINDARFVSDDFMQFIESSAGNLDALLGSLQTCKKHMILDETCSNAMIMMTESFTEAMSRETINNSMKEMCKENANCAVASMESYDAAMSCIRTEVAKVLLPDSNGSSQLQTLVNSAIEELDTLTERRNAGLKALCEVDVLSGDYCEAAKWGVQTTHPDFASYSPEKQCATIKRVGCCAVELQGFLTGDIAESCVLPVACPKLGDIVKGVKIDIQISDIASVLGVSANDYEFIANRINEDVEFFSDLTQRLAAYLDIDQSYISIGDISIEDIKNGDVTLRVLAQGADEASFDQIKDKVTTILSDDSSFMQVEGGALSGSSDKEAKLEVKVVDSNEVKTDQTGSPSSTDEDVEITSTSGAQSLQQLCQVVLGVLVLSVANFLS